ncbi:PEP-CTERM sorting domain-containing protein [Pseudomonadota bacterium]
MISMRNLFIALLFATFFSSQAHAISITDRWLGDQNIILDADQAGNTFTVREDYNEDDRVPFPSHDGKAVVDILPTGEVHYFDKIIDLENNTGIWTFTFNVHNTTRWDWSDYHFLFYDEFFERAIDIENILLDWSNNVVFQNSSLSGNELQFWAPNWHESGATHDYSLILNVDALPRRFGIRQIATVPEPTTLALMGFAVAGLGFQRRKKYCE